MRLYRLTPFDVVNGSWEFSHFCNVIIVRAETEADAREEAVSRLLRMPEVLPEGREVFSPWGDRSLVACAPVDPTAELTADGEPGIVWPPAVVRMVNGR